MTVIPIYAASGDQVGSIKVGGELEYVSGRTSRIGDTYYKGLGAPYSSHLTLDPDEGGVKQRSAVFYCGYHAQSPKYAGKSGIIQRRYHPYFSDFIGSCGPKELAVIRNSVDFEKSAVKVIDYVEYDRKNHQYYFVLKYKTGRTDYINDGGTPEALLELLRFMVLEGWCFPWDKTSIRDITADGLVHDVADLFRSTNPVNLFGSVYSALYSLHELDREKYIEVAEIPPIVATYAILNSLGVRIQGDMPEGYYIEYYLLPGRNCAHVENKDLGDGVKKQYQSIYRRMQCR